MIKQIASQKFVSDCGKASLTIENDMPVGNCHDFLLRLKGQMVDIMVSAQKQENELAEEQKKASEQQCPQEVA